MPENWKTYKLKDIVDQDRGISYGIVQPGKHDPNGVPILKINNLTGNSFNINDLHFVSKNVEEKYKKTRLRGSELLVSLVGSLGEVYTVPSEMVGYNVVRALAVIPVLKEFSPNWVKYWLKAPIAQNILQQIATTSVQATINLKELREIKIPFPAKFERDTIASILSAIDDKIELNLQMNKTLEEIAMASYKHRFIDFGPFLNSKFTESELGKIPEGWKVKKLSDILKFKKDNIKASKITENLPYVPIDCLAPKSLLLDTFKPGYEAKSSLVKFQKGDFLFGAMRPYFHKVCIAPFDGITRSTAFVFKPNIDFYYSFGLCLLNQETTISFSTANSQGSTIPYAKWKNVMSDMQIVVPTDRLIKEFNGEVYNFFNIIIELFHENQNLIKLRDTLLPKLISGEVRVKDAEKTLSEVL